MAAMRTVEELLARSPSRYAITVIGAEPHPNYNRIMLSSVLAGEKTVDEIVINPRAWYDDNAVALLTGTPASAIAAAAKTVSLADGSVIPYDKLLLGTGSKPLAPPIPGLNLPGVRAFRDIGD
ncbi:MAG: FAD-dependent oxidoreductase, partial [Alphaproteobacteria bacterium]|nr:FAD-dependent oxidoreductase [Alphaproteobacteria bacterium]